MKKYGIVILALLASSAFGQSPSRLSPSQLTSSPSVPAPERVATDAVVIDRVAEVSKRDLPTDLLRRMVTEDLELLRGRRADGSYDYASHERFEASRVSDSFSVQPRADKMQTVELKGAWVYRVNIEVPSRRMLVRKNRPIWVERADVQYVAEGSTQTQTQTFDVKAWMQPGEVRPIDLPAIARQATVKLIATAEEKGGYGNVDLALLQARIVDKPDSPYAEAVTHAKAVQRALDNGDLSSLRASAQRIRSALGSRGTTMALVQAVPVQAVPVVPPPPSNATLDVVADAVAPQDTATRVELQTELQLIEDLLTGSETEKRDGMNRLHQLVRRMRP
jgi:hypothetical protein